MVVPFATGRMMMTNGRFRGEAEARGAAAARVESHQRSGSI
jgi:hypothetical protein